MSLVKSIKDQNSFSDVEFILTREEDRNMNYNERLDLANEANLFLSVHINRHDDQKINGIEVYYSDENAQSELSKNYSNIIASNIKFRESTSSIVKQASFYVLRNAKSPAILLEVGFISNNKDLEYLRSNENIKLIAQSILVSVAQFRAEVDIL